MNIFATDQNPHASAIALPDKHIVKMPLECCQMLSIIFSSWYRDWGTLPKMDGTPYSTKKGAFRNHPSTKWAAENNYNTAWLIAHGIALCSEYKFRYGKIHSCNNTLFEAKKLFHRQTFPVLCRKSLSSMILSTLLLHTRCTLHQNRGYQQTTYANLKENPSGSNHIIIFLL